MHGTLLSKTLHCSSSTEAIAALGNTCWVDLDNYNRDFIMEQHAGIGIGRSSVVFVYFLNFSVVKKSDDYWSEAICGLAVFQSSQSHYYIFTCSTCGDRVTLSAPQYFSFVVPCYFIFLSFIYFFIFSFLFMTGEL